MQFMVIRLADAGVACARPAHAAGAPLALDFGPPAGAVRLSLAPGGERIEHGPFAGTAIAGFAVIEADSKEGAIAQLAREHGGDGVTFELREPGCPGGCPTVAEAGAHDGPRYAILLRATTFTETDDAPPQSVLDTLNAFNAEQAAAGRLLAGDGLKSSARGVRVRPQGGRASIIDGPFAEAKELIAGFWLVRAASMEDALAFARTIPYPTGPVVDVELRAVVPAATGLSPHEARLDTGLRAEGLDAALRAELAARPAWR